MGKSEKSFLQFFVVGFGLAVAAIIILQLGKQCPDGATREFQCPDGVTAITQTCVNGQWTGEC